MNRSQSVSMITTRVRDILNEIEERGSDLNVCPAEDVFGPGGGVYITRVTPLNLKHLEWMEGRSARPATRDASDVMLMCGGNSSSTRLVSSSMGRSGGVDSAVLLYLPCLIAAAFCSYPGTAAQPPSLTSRFPPRFDRVRRRLPCSRWGRPRRSRQVRIAAAK